MRSTKDIHSASLTVSYYLYIFYTIFWLALLLLLPSLVLFLLNLFLKEEGELNFFETLSSSKLKEGYFPVNTVIHYLMAMLLFLTYHKIRNKSVYYMRKGHNPRLAHFSVALKNLPEAYVDDEIKEMFKKTFPNGEISVADVQPTYNIATYMKYFRKLARLRKQKKEIQEFRHGHKSCALRCKSKRTID